MIVLFGGGDGQAFDDTWLWNGRTWAEQTPPSAPSARLRAAFAYDPVTLQLVLFGGEGLAEALADTWTWDGTTWTAVAAQPELRRDRPGEPFGLRCRPAGAAAVPDHRRQVHLGNFNLGVEWHRAGQWQVSR